jgi:hypothetical protein
VARTATVRSASLAPDEARLADELAETLTRGSFTELTRMLLLRFGEPLKRQIEALRESGIDPNERLMVTNATPPDTDEQIADFYAPSTWSEDGPKRP